MDSVMEHPERWATALGGAALVVWGAKKLSQERHPVGALLATTGASLIWRSTRDTRARLGGARGTGVEESVAINRGADELYEFWRNLELLPMVMPELNSVRDRRAPAIALDRQGTGGMAHGMVRRHHQRDPERAARLANRRGLGACQRRLGPLRAWAGRPRHRRAGQAAVRPSRRKVGRRLCVGIRRRSVAA